MSEEGAIPRRAVTIAEAAEALGISTDLVRTMIDEGELRVIRWRRRVIVPVVAIDQWIDEQLAGGTAWSGNGTENAAMDRVRRINEKTAGGSPRSR